MEPDPTLIVVAVRAESAEDLEPLIQTLVSATTTAEGTMVLVVDDRSPEPQAQMIEALCTELECAYVLQQDGEGHSAAVNVGLTVAVEHGMDVCLVAPGATFESRGWLDRLRARTDLAGEPAAIAGGALLETGGTIRHAGYFFSLFRRAWSARLRMVPEELLDVEQPLLCPVGSELLFVRRAWIEQIGGFDDLLEGPHAALDYCLRVSAAGGQCVFEPTVRARYVEPLADAEPDDGSPSARRLRLKHANVSFQRWSPEVI